MGASVKAATLRRYRSSVDLVLAGGGVKGIAHVGALEALHAAGYTDHPRVAGTSVGALIGALVAIGKPLPEIREIVMDFPFRKIERDRTLVARVPVVGTPTALLAKYGVCTGDELQRELEKHLGTITFAQLRADWEDRRRDARKPIEDIAYPFVALATDLTRGELVQFPRDLDRYPGMTEENTRVADIVRASASVPLFFEPAEFGGSLFVDGGVLANFATDIFDRGAEAVHQPDGSTTLEYRSRWPTFGISLLYCDKAEDVGTDLIGGVTGDWLAERAGLLGLGRFSQGLIGTLVAGQDANAATNPHYAPRTVRVDTTAAQIIDFGIKPPRREEVRAQGEVAMRDFLDDVWAGPGRPEGHGFDGRKFFPLPGALKARQERARAAGIPA